MSKGSYLSWSSSLAMHPSVLKASVTFLEIVPTDKNRSGTSFFQLYTFSDIDFRKRLLPIDQGFLFLWDSELQLDFSIPIGRCTKYCGVQFHFLGQRRLNSESIANKPNQKPHDGLLHLHPPSLLRSKQNITGKFCRATS